MRLFCAIEDRRDNYATFYPCRFATRLVPGGLTGLYQTNKSAESLRDYQKFVQEGVALDRDYYQFLLEASPLEVVFMDLKILWRTMRTVFERQGV